MIDKPNLFLNQKFKTLINIVFKLFVFIGCIYSSTAIATSLQITADGGPPSTFNLDPNSAQSVDLLAYSRFEDIVNEDPSHPIVPIPIVFSNPRSFFPPVGIVGEPKANLTVTSNSPTIGTIAAALAQLELAQDNNKCTLETEVTAFDSAAAASCFDDVRIFPGTYTHAPFIDNIMFEFDNLPGEHLQVNYSANDSRFTEALWELIITADDVLNNRDDLFISFVSNPILNLVDSDVEDTVRNAFDPTGRMLENLVLFDTTYIVDELTVFSEGPKGLAQQVPEPETIVLLLLGLVGLNQSKREPKIGQAYLFTETTASRIY